MSVVGGILGSLPIVGGAIQAIDGGITRHKETKALERLRTPTYTPNKSISDYFQAAQNRYDTSPYQSAEYNYALQRSRENAATALAGLQDRRNSLAGISAINNNTNNAGIRAGIQAEAERRANFGVLGNATSMKAGDDRVAFNQNVLAPYQKKVDLITAKAGAAGQRLNAGLSNTFNGLMNAGLINAAAQNQDLYGTVNTMNAGQYGGYGAIQRNPLSNNNGDYA